jgi:hypothetical protein
MKLPVAFCPTCRRDVLVHLAVPDGEDPMTAELELRCVDCDAPVGRRGLPLMPDERGPEETGRMGYSTLDLDGEGEGD